jgi:hypothetical protein
MIPTIHARIGWADRVRFIAHEVVEAVSSSGVDKAITYPFCRLDANKK